MALTSIGARRAGLLESAELRTYDTFLARLPLRQEPGPQITLVWIREEEVQEYGHPLSDANLSVAIRAVLAAGTQVIGLDLYRERPVAPGSEELERLARDEPRLVFVEKLADDASPAVPPPFFAGEGDRVGFTDFPVDRDGVVRRGLLILWDDQDRAHLSFSLQLALGFLQKRGITLTQDPVHPDFVRLGAITLPALDRNLGGYANADAGGYQYLLDQRRLRRAFPQFSFSELMRGEIPDSQLRERIVILATASPSVKDSFLTSRSVGMYGGELHAAAADQLLRHALHGEPPLGSFGELAETSWIALWALLGALVGMFIRSPAALALAAGTGALGLGGAGYAALASGWWIPVLPAGLCGLGSLGLCVAYVVKQERDEKALIFQLFGRFVSRAVVSEIWDSRLEFMRGDRPRSERQTITVLFTDLIGYSTASEKLDPDTVMNWIGTYMETMTNAVEQHRGIVNDFIGDGLMANFGVPVPRESEQEISADAVNAVACALQMERELVRLNERWRRAGLPTGRMRVGIFTGPAVVGAYGSEQHLKYTSVGATVNTASRLESFDKLGFETEPEPREARILVGEPTWKRLGGRFRGECIGAHQLKGNSEPVTIYRIHGRR